MMTHFDDQLHLYVIVHVRSLCCWSTKDTFDHSTTSLHNYWDIIMSSLELLCTILVCQWYTNRGLLYIFTCTRGLMILRTYLDTHLATYSGLCNQIDHLWLKSITSRKVVGLSLVFYSPNFHEHAWDWYIQYLDSKSTDGFEYPFGFTLISQGCMSKRSFKLVRYRRVIQCSVKFQWVA